MYSEGLIKVTKLGTFYSNVFIFEFLMYYVRILQCIFFFFETPTGISFPNKKGSTTKQNRKLNT